MKFSKRLSSMQESPIRKLAPFATAAKAEGVEVYLLLEQRLYLYVGEVDLLVRGEEAVVVTCGLDFFCCALALA